MKPDLADLVDEILQQYIQPLPPGGRAAAVLEKIKKKLGVEAVGLRFYGGEDFPFYSALVFSPEFLETENHLCRRDEAGKICRNENGEWCLRRKKNYWKRTTSWSSAKRKLSANC